MTDVPEIDVTELAKRRAEPIVLVDVRNPDEYDAAHVPGALLLPLHELPERAGELPAEEVLFLICGTGGRSRIGAQHLIERGFDAVNVAGGTRAWIEAGNEVAAGRRP